MSELDTVELDHWVKRLAAGDPAARDHLLAHTGERFARIAGKMLRGGFARLAALEETQDIVQNVYVKLLTNWESFAGTGGGEPLRGAADYLIRGAKLIRHELVDLSRKHYGRGTVRPRQQPLDGATDSAPGFDPGTETLEPGSINLFAEFHEAVDGLPDELRAVVDLHWYQDLTHQETADLLGIAEVTSRKYWTKARLLLQKKFPDGPFA